MLTTLVHGFVVLLTLIIIVGLHIAGVAIGNTQGAILPHVGGREVASKNSKLQNSIYEKYKYLIPKGRMTFDEFCYPKSYSVQPQQLFVGEYMRPGPHPKEILIYHKIGAGKTCLAIQVAERWTHLGKPLVIMPASLVPGFRNELRSKCAGDNYISSEDREALAASTPGSPAYKSILEASNTLIDASYNILSYNMFLTHGAKLKAPILIIDEVQNINNPLGKVFGAVMAWIRDNLTASIVIMSGTPLFDKPSEINGLARLLRVDVPHDIIAPGDVSSLLSGKISYFAGAPKFTFPDVDIKVKQCIMSKFQAKWYRSEVEAESRKRGNEMVTMLTEVSNDFYIKSRQRSNVVYPEGLVGTLGISKMTHTHFIHHLDTYSAKMSAMLPKLTKGKLSFIYSGFTGYGGIKFITHVLDAYGYKDYFKEGPGRRRYAIWSGDQSSRTKDIIRATYNSPSNDNAEHLQIVIGSPSIKEGVTLLRTRQVHILEAYWNHSRLEQIFGRAVRYCSHKSLPKADRNVVIYIYAGTTRRYSAAQMARGVDPNDSIDLYMLAMADAKKTICEQYLNAMIDCAVDKYLWQEP